MTTNKGQRSLLGDLAEEERKREHFLELAYGSPRKKLTGRVTLSEAVALFTDSKSKVEKDKARRTILKAVREDRLRLHAASVDALARSSKKSATRKDLQALARMLAMHHWSKRPRDTVAIAAAAVQHQENRLHAFQVSTIVTWIRDLRPENFI